MAKLLEAGTAAPEFELADPNGRPVRLADYRGHVLVLAFLRGFM